MNDFYEVRNSIYCYPNSNVLKNKLDIMDATKLQKVETQLVLIKLYELRQKGIIDIEYIFENPGGKE